MEGSLIGKRRESYCQTSLGNYVADKVSSFWTAPESKAQSHKQKLQRGKFQFIIWKIYIYTYWLLGVFQQWNKLSH